MSERFHFNQILPVALCGLSALTACDRPIQQPNVTDPTIPSTEPPAYSDVLALKPSYLAFPDRGITFGQLSMSDTTNMVKYINIQRINQLKEIYELSNWKISIQFHAYPTSDFLSYILSTSEDIQIVFNLTPQLSPENLVTPEESARLIQTEIDCRLEEYFARIAYDNEQGGTGDSLYAEDFDELARRTYERRLSLLVDGYVAPTILLRANLTRYQAETRPDRPIYISDRRFPAPALPSAQEMIYHIATENRS